MASTDSHDPVEHRVLAVLTSGANTATGIAEEVGEPDSVVKPILEQWVTEEAAKVLDLPGLPTYALTPKGLTLLGVAPAPAETVEPPETGEALHVDPAPTALPPSDLPPIPPEDLGRAPVPAGQVSLDPAPRPVVRRHVVYAVGYVVLGIVLLVFAPVVGVLSILAGLVLGAFALRPLFASSGPKVTGR